MDLVSYLESRGVRLQRCGTGLKGFCPFHGERTPSFYVYDTHAHCYGCQAHLFDIVDAIWKLEFPQDTTRARAIKRARDLHITVEPLKLPTRRELPLATPEQTLAMEVAFGLWHSYLTDEGIGQKAREWISARGLQGRWMDRIWPQLGYMPTGSRACSTLAQKLQVILGDAWVEVARSVGILTPSGHFGYRGRVIFTTERKGHIVFFQGRILRDDTDAPKYLNPPNLRKFAFIPIPSEDALYEGTAICEGPLDAFALAASGIYAIGVAGSNLATLRQSDVRGTVFDYLDNEPEGKAGAEASKKLQQWCEKNHLPYQKAAFPAEIKDPIRWVSAYGAEHLVSAHLRLAA